MENKKNNNNYRNQFEIIKATKKKHYDKLTISIQKDKNKWVYLTWFSFAPVKRNENWVVITVKKKNPVTNQEQDYATFDYENKVSKKMSFDDIIKLKYNLDCLLWYANVEWWDSFEMSTYWIKWYLNINWKSINWKRYLNIKYTAKSSNKTFETFLSDSEIVYLQTILDMMIRKNINDDFLKQN